MKGTPIIFLEKKYRRFITLDEALKLFVMPRLMAIDYGTKRVGIAVTDSSQMIATALATVHSKDIFQFLADYFKKEEVECVVIGEPKQMNNRPSESAVYVNKFIAEFIKKFPHKIVQRMDERFTSKIAAQTMLQAGLKKQDRRDKKILDVISATLILQSYLEQKK